LGWPVSDSGPLPGRPICPLARQRLISARFFSVPPSRHNAVVDLPDDLVLPLPSGEPWWYWLGGRPSLDFVNTLRERWWRNVETLVTPDDLARWLERAELLPPGSGLRPSVALLRRARELRESIDAAVVAAARDEAIEPRALQTIDSWLPAAVTYSTLVLGRDGTPLLAASAPADPLEHALGLVALDAARMLGTPEQRVRARICASDTCSARFYDRSPTAGRLWCSMRACGNVAKARRHRERVRGAREL
jgi:predicted RNA-binding Zn ribbon-like protein